MGDVTEEISEVKKLWNSHSENAWNQRLAMYWTMDSVQKHYDLEKELHDLQLKTVEDMSADSFYDFLLKQYFVWKHTTPNRFKTTIAELKKYETEGKEELGPIKQELFRFYKQCPDGTRGLMEEVTKIHGLGSAGGSGLLAILFPEHYGTIDQFVVKSLQKVGLDSVRGMDPENLTIEDAVVLEDIYRRKAGELNDRFGTTAWTPRKIDMVLWTFREECKEKKGCKEEKV